MTEPLPSSISPENATENDAAVLTEQLPLFEELPDETHLSTPNQQDDTSGGGAATCHFCGRSVDPSSDATYSEIRSWVHGAKKDSSVLREYTGLYADSTCIAKLRAKHHPKQKELLEILSEDPVSDRATEILATDRSLEFVAGYQAGLSGHRIDNVSEDDFGEGYLEGSAMADALLYGKVIEPGSRNW